MTICLRVGLSVTNHLSVCLPVFLYAILPVCLSFCGFDYYRFFVLQFLHNGSNKRTDSYGGSVENRSRLLFEVIEAVQQGWKEAVGAASPHAKNVGLRLAPFGTFLDMSDSNESELYDYILPGLNKFNLAYVHVCEPRVAGSVTAAGATGDEPEEIVYTICKKFTGTLITAGARQAGRLIGRQTSRHRYA